MKPTIWIFSIEPISTRYTGQWHQHIPDLLTQQLGHKYNVVQIDGIQKNTETTPGAFLNFSDTNYWKSSQLCAFLDHYNNGLTTKDDQILFTDAWNPTIIQLKYMSSLLGMNWKIHGLWHAGSYDPADFLGRLIGNAAWVRHTEKSLFHSIDHNYFATDFHIEMFCKNLFECNVEDITEFNKNKIIRTGWPMEYMDSALSTYKGAAKRDLILFPHRVAPEKQPEIFRDLQQQLPQYEFVVCQDQKLSKEEYHTLLSQAKIVFSANLQETLGISCYEGAVVDAVPMVPDRLSYSEMYYEGFKYPSQWTESWNHYIANRQQLCHHIIVTMTHYDTRVPQVQKLAKDLTEYFFTATNLLDNLK